MNPVLVQKCPSCGAAARFHPSTGKLVCDHCGTVMDIEQLEKEQQAAISGFDFNQLADQVSYPGADDLPIYHCQSCGAEVIAPAEQIALTCPYCGSNIVLVEKASGKLRPDGVIPFRIESKDLPASVSRFYKDKKLLPRHFFSESTMGKVTGVYVPFWIFNGQMSGNLYFSAERSSSHRKGDYIYITTKYYHLDRDVSLGFANLPVDASEKVDNKLMDSLEPFDMQDARPFDMRYLAGFTADRFDQAKKDVAGRAEKRMRNSAAGIVSSNAGKGYSNVRPAGGKLHADLKAQYLLFPVYMFDIIHDRRNYHFAVNGQTGKVVGNLPTDQKVSTRYFFTRTAAVSGVLILYSIIKYMLGW